MPDSRSLLEIVVDVKNAATGASDLRSVGKAADESGKGAKTAGGQLKNLAVAAGGLVAVRKGTEYMRSAVDASTTLARSTAALTRATGMDTQTASAWVSMAKSRGIETKALTTSFTAFSKQIRAAEGGSKASVQAFKDLGIQASALQGMSFDETLTKTADAFANLPAGADKSALAVKMFGKQGLALLPLLNLGSEGLTEQMDVMKKHGLTMDESGIKKGLELAKTQRDMKATTEGLKVSIGTALMPAVASMGQGLLTVIGPMVSLVQQTPMLGTAIVALGVGVGALVVGLKLAAVAQALFGTGSIGAAAGAKIAAAAQWLWNAAMTANPIGIVVVAIAALVAALVLAYNKVGWFRNGVNAAFSAVKSAVSAVGSAFSAAASAVGSAVSAIVAKVAAMVKPITAAVDSVKNVLGGIGSAVGDAASGVASAASSILPFAAGGTVPVGGTLALVGERGPELMQLPGGARITPLAAGTPEPVDMSSLGGGRDIHVHLDVEGRELAHVIARETSDQQARR